MCVRVGISAADDSNDDDDDESVHARANIPHLALFIFTPWPWLSGG